MDWIELTDLKVDAIVGILPFERVTPQPVELAIRLGMPLGPIGDSGDLGLGVDYAAVEQQVRFAAEAGRFWLIETLGLALARWLLLEPTPDEERGRIEAVEVSIRKPTILEGRAVPGVRIARSGEGRVGELFEGTEVIALVRTERDALSRVRLDDSGFSLPEQHCALLIAGSARAAERSLAPGDRVAGPAELRGTGTLMVVRR